MLTTFHPGSSNHIFHYNFHTVIFLSPVIFPHKGYRNSPCIIRAGWEEWGIQAVPYWSRDVTAGMLLSQRLTKQGQTSTLCTEQCPNMASRRNTFFPPILSPITAFFCHGMPSYLTGRDWSRSVKSFRPGMAFGQPQLHWLQLRYFLKSGAQDPHFEFNQSAQEEEEGRTRHDCGLVRPLHVSSKLPPPLSSTYYTLTIL